MNSKHYTLAEVLRDEYRALRPHCAVPEPDRTANAQDAQADLEAVQQQLLNDPDGLTALCLSGGGIRSATFALGVVQGLAKLGLLQRFDYLSTVSGGGYLGGWLSAWAQRHPRGIAGVSDELVGDPAAGTAPDRDPPPVCHLREYSNYLAPRLGPLSVDAWTLIATYVRNLTLNWLVILPVLFLVLSLPRWYVQALAWSPDLVQLGVVAVGIGLLMLRGLNYVGTDRPSGGGHNRDQRAFLRGCLTPLGLAVVLISLAWVWFLRGLSQDYPWLMEAWFIVPFSGLVYLFSWLRHVVNMRWRLRGITGFNKLREGAAALVSGLVAGGLVWVWTRVFDVIPSEPVGIALYTCFAAPALWLAFTWAETIFIGLSSRVTGEEDREWWARSGAWIMIAMNLWIALCVIVVFGPELLLYVWEMAAALGGVTGILTYWAARSTLNDRRVNLEAEARGAGTEGGFSRQRLAGMVLRVTAPLTVLALLMLMAFVGDVLITGQIPTASTEHLALLRDTRLEQLLYACLIAAGIGMAMSPFINVNRFSLHAMYRNRLMRAYLGASRQTLSRGSPTKNNFTGFDPRDNLDMHQLWPSKTAATEARAPLHVVNIALNLVRGRNLAWQQRKAASFTVSPLHAGGNCVGYRSADHYGGGDGISLGTAVTISGAAASPCMGYHTKPSLSFLLSLFNARLGWWLGNPNDDETWMQPGPRFSIAPLRDEMLGLTNADNPWVYLSDGGHFENLGLYEMIQRRCRLIVVSDAGADPSCSFEDLGNALRKIRADLGVRIELDGDERDRRINIFARGDANPDGRYCALFNIYYTEAGAEANRPEGRLLYLKPALYGQEPLDVCNYARECPEFPHEPTSDQFFSESQFESYRHLGEHVIQTLAGGGQRRQWELQDLFAAARRYCHPPK